MKLKDYQEVERAAGVSRGEVGRIGAATLFVAADAAVTPPTGEPHPAE